MKTILREEDMPLTGEFRPSAVLGAISRAKNEMLDADFLAENAVNHHQKVIARLAKRYVARLKQVGALDFDDLLLEAVRLFDEAPDALARYQDRWRYLHVDEYQDTNRPQYLWIRALAVGCGVWAEAHGRRMVRVRDLPIGGRPVVLCWCKRIWRCREPACSVRTWTERTAAVCPRGGADRAGPRRGLPAGRQGRPRGRYGGA